MKLIYQALGLILGFIIGLLTSFAIVSSFMMWVVVDSKKPTATPKYTGYYSSSRNRKTSTKEKN